MIILTDKDTIKESGIVATIGFFDGVHVGHRFLIHQLIEESKKKGLPSAVITFSKHPRLVLNSEYQPKLLNSFEEKLKHLLETGIDYCIPLDFTVELSRLSAVEFITSVLAEKLHVKTLLIGYDHRFGHDRKDGFEEYREYAGRCGMEVIEATSYKESGITISSSEIRKELSQGSVEKASRLLTYPYMIKGTIIDGFKVGRQIGFPTANIQSDEPFKVVPGIGVYAVRVLVKGCYYKGMLYIGKRPTLENGDNITLEVHIIDFEDDIYQEEISVFFLHYIRGDIKFDSLEELKNQLEKDKQEVISLLK